MAQPSQPIAGMQQAPTIIVVDDSEICRMVARHFLEAGGYRVVELDSPFGLVDALRRHQPVLVLIDLQMPLLDGSEVIELVQRQELSCCPFVLYSARQEDRLAAIAQTSGAAGYVCKAASSSSLISTIQRLAGPPA